MRAHLTLLRRLRGLGFSDPKITEALTLEGGLQVTVRAKALSMEICVSEHLCAETVSRMWHTEASESEFRSIGDKFEKAAPEVFVDRNSPARITFQEPCRNCWQQGTRKGV